MPKMRKRIKRKKGKTPLFNNNTEKIYGGGMRLQ